MNKCFYMYVIFAAFIGPLPAHGMDHADASSHTHSTDTSFNDSDSAWGSDTSSSSGETSLSSESSDQSSDQSTYSDPSDSSVHANSPSEPSASQGNGAAENNPIQDHVQESISFSSPSTDLTNNRSNSGQAITGQYTDLSPEQSLDKREKENVWGNVKSMVHHAPFSSHLAPNPAKGEAQSLPDKEKKDLMSFEEKISLGKETWALQSTRTPIDATMSSQLQDNRSIILEYRLSTGSKGEKTILSSPDLAHKKFMGIKTALHNKKALLEQDIIHKTYVNLHQKGLSGKVIGKKMTNLLNTMQSQRSEHKT